jgi:hypothetical protein
VKEAGGRCLFVGALAVSVWGAPRTSQDADVLLLIDAERFPVLVRSLKKHGLETSALDLADGLRTRTHVTVWAAEGRDLWIDVTMAVSESERSQVLRGVPVHGVAVSTVEDTIAYKLLFGSAKDIEDVRSIIRRNAGRVDESALRSRMQGLGLDFRRYRRLKLDSRTE